MKVSALLAGNPFSRQSFFTKEHACIALCIIQTRGRQDACACQYAMWILTQFVSTPVFQHQVANHRGVELFLTCITKDWPDEPQVVLRGLIALYACVRMNPSLREEYVEQAGPVIIKVLRQYPDHAKMNIFGCWLLYELVTCCPEGLKLLGHAETVTDIQAIVTRFHNDEVVRLAATLVLESLVAVVDDCKEPLRLGVARGGLS